MTGLPPSAFVSDISAVLTPLFGPTVAEERARNIVCACLGLEGLPFAAGRAHEIATAALSRGIPTIRELLGKVPIDEGARVAATVEVAMRVAAHLRGERSVPPRYILDNGSPGYPDLHELSLEQFVESNSGEGVYPHPIEDDTVEALRALAIGETFHGNEGAGGTWSMTRVA